MERRLAAILVADIVGYSRMMGRDEERTFRWNHPGPVVGADGHHPLGRIHELGPVVRMGIELGAGAVPHVEGADDPSRMSFFRH